MQAGRGMLPHWTLGGAGPTSYHWRWHSLLGSVSNVGLLLHLPSRYGLEHCRVRLHRLEASATKAAASSRRSWQVLEVATPQVTGGHWAKLALVMAYIQQAVSSTMAPGSHWLALHFVHSGHQLRFQHRICSNSHSDAFSRWDMF